MGWEHAFDADELGFSRGATFEPRAGNRVEVLVDGSTYLPAVAEAIAGARSHVHLLGWCFSPELNLTREEEPVVLRNLLSDVARRVDVRLLVWEGAPFPVFRPTKRDVQSYMKVFTRGTNIQAETDSCVRLKYSHHEKIVLVDDEVAFVGGIDLTLDGGDPFDTPKHPSRGSVGWHDAAMRIEGPAVDRRREPLPASLARPGRGAAAGARTAGAEGGRRAADRADDPRGRLRRRCRRATSACSSRTGARSGARSASSTSRTSSCGRRRSSRSSSDKLRDPPCDEFRVVAVLPARPNDGADVSRGAISALIHADDGNERFLACTLYARTGPLRDLVYVHSKIGIVDDRWLTIGSANLNERSMFNDSEVNVVTLDEALARRTRLGLWEEHLETADVDGDPTQVVDELWRPRAVEQLEHLEHGRPLTHRLVMLPGVSRRARRISGVVKSRVYDG